MDYVPSKYIQGLRHRDHEPLQQGTGPRSAVTVLLGVFSFAAGFALVFVFFRSPALHGPAPVPGPIPDAGPARTAVEEAEVDTETSVESYAEGDAVPEVPPGRTPEGVWVHGAPKYLKCWDVTGAERDGASCDSLRVLEKRFSTRLYVVDRCKRAHSSAQAQGELSLGAEVDFKQNSISFWSGPSSTLDNARRIGTCVRQELSGLPIHSIDHKLERYRLFFTVEFRDANELRERIENKKRRGRLVGVVKDRVRVRSEPVQGYVLGKVSTGAQVTLLKRKDDWCHVITPNMKEGWLICEALSL